MSFLTALSLSFQNLRSKKARTLLTAFAGSIGIIGISLILSLSTGVNNYIETVEEDTLSEYPLTIQSSSMDMSAMLAGMTGQDDEGSAGVRGQRGGDAHPDLLQDRLQRPGLAQDLPGQRRKRIEAYTSAVEYSYAVTPQIYLWQDGGYRQVNPDNSFAPLGFGASGTSNSMMSAMTSTDVFYQMPADPELYRDQYTVQAGRWPERYNECVLVLTSGGSVSDFMLYSLGLRDGDELDTMVQQFAEEEKVSVPRRHHRLRLRRYPGHHLQAGQRRRLLRV